MQAKVELEGVNGKWFNLTTGDQGVWLDEGPEGLFYDPPVKTVWEEPANLAGARFLAHRILRRDVVFTALIFNEKGRWRRTDSEWRKAWSYTDDCKVHVTTEDGHRILNLRLAEQPEVKMIRDPDDEPYLQITMTCAAGDPFWYGDTEMVDWETPTSTLDGSTISHTFVFNEDNPLNPTDQYLRQRWWCSAPGVWTLPDYSFIADDFSDREIVMPQLLINENIVVDLDPMSPQVVSENGAQVWARMNGVQFMNSIPPYTIDAELTVEVSKAPVGSRVELYLDRPWSRPWGLW